MMRVFLISAIFFPVSFAMQDTHNHPAPEKLGTVTFQTSCKPDTQQQFNRAIALLHSFAYTAAEEAFQTVAEQDPRCAIAHWGIAMTHYHQLWEPALPAGGIAVAQKEIALAVMLQDNSFERERGLIHALGLVLEDASTVPYSARASNYANAMHALAAENPNDAEIQVFCALTLISNASPSDKEHRKQKQAADLLEPMWRKFPDHPGIPHYLIHACDSQELASRGLAAAGAYAHIAPSAPHALHMPSHIFTRLGLWDDSIASNVAARDAAQRQGDTCEELHAMDYLVYAYLQSGRDNEVAKVIQQLKAMRNLRIEEFKSGYAATAMPIRYIVERRQWSDAETISAPPDDAPPQAQAIAVWARGIGFAHNGRALQAEKESETLGHINEQPRKAGNDYWATQADILRREVLAWSAQAQQKPGDAEAIQRGAANDEDGIEKLPVTLDQLFLPANNSESYCWCKAILLRLPRHSKRHLQMRLADGGQCRRQGVPHILIEKEAAQAHMDEG